VLTNASGSFSDDNGTPVYPDYARCEWILAPNGAEQITISFTEFNTEANCDYVRVYACESILCASKTLLAELHGTYGSPMNFSSTTPFMYVIFTTDGSVVRSGFRATWWNSTGQPLIVSYLRYV
jgi:hypothetical protein